MKRLHRTREKKHIHHCNTSMGELEDKSSFLDNRLDSQHNYLWSDSRMDREQYHSHTEQASLEDRMARTWMFPTESYERLVTYMTISAWMTQRGISYTNHIIAIEWLVYRTRNSLWTLRISSIIGRNPLVVHRGADVVVFRHNGGVSLTVGSHTISWCTTNGMERITVIAEDAVTRTRHVCSIIANIHVLRVFALRETLRLCLYALSISTTNRSQWRAAIVILALFDCTNTISSDTFVGRSWRTCVWSVIRFTVKRRSLTSSTWTFIRSRVGTTYGLFNSPEENTIVVQTTWFFVYTETIVATLLTHICVWSNTNRSTSAKRGTGLTGSVITTNVVKVVIGCITRNKNWTFIGILHTLSIETTNGLVSRAGIRE